MNFDDHQMHLEIAMRLALKMKERYMTQQKYIVTDDQLQNLFESGMRNANVLAQRSFVKQNSVYKQCLEIPYVEPADDWRKKWKDVDRDGDKVLFVAEGNNKVVAVFSGKNGPDAMQYAEPYLFPVEPEVVKVERWLLLDRHGNSFGFAYSSEQTAREACCELEKACRFIKVEGSYTK